MLSPCRRLTALSFTIVVHGPPKVKDCVLQSVQFNLSSNVQQCHHQALRILRRKRLRSDDSIISLFCYDITLLKFVSSYILLIIGQIEHLEWKLENRTVVPISPP